MSRVSGLAGRAGRRLPGRGERRAAGRASAMLAQRTHCHSKSPVFLPWSVAAITVVKVCVFLYSLKGLSHGHRLLRCPHSSSTRL